MTIINKFRIKNDFESAFELTCKMSDCPACKNNFEHRFYTGSSNAKIMIINDCATKDEEIIEYYNDLINLSNLKANDVMQVYAVSCITTRKDKDRIVQRMPSKKECNNCKPDLDKIIDIVKPKVIISLGATALNQFKPGSNLLEYVNSKQVFNGIPTLINFSVKDLFNLCEYKSDEEIDEISSSILATFNEAAKYIQGGSNE